MGIRTLDNSIPLISLFSLGEVRLQNGCGSRSTHSIFPIFSVFTIPSPTSNVAPPSPEMGESF